MSQLLEKKTTFDSYKNRFSFAMGYKKYFQFMFDCKTFPKTISRNDTKKNGIHVFF